MEQLYYIWIILHRSSDLGTIDRRTSSILQIMIPTNLLGSCLLQFSRNAAVMWNSPCSTRRSIRNQRRAETTLFLIIVWEVFKVFSPTTLLLSARVCCCCFFRRNSSDHRRWTTAKLVHHINLNNQEEEEINNKLSYLSPRFGFGWESKSGWPFICKKSGDFITERDD